GCGMALKWRISRHGLSSWYLEQTRRSSMTQYTNQGFTLIELMIVIAIIGILGTIALPVYQTYTQRAAFAEVVLATTPYKSAFEVAAQTSRITALADADAGANGIPADAGATGRVVSVTMADGVITATGATEVGGYTYVLTPDGIAAPIQWDVSGTCIGAGVC